MTDFWNKYYQRPLEKIPWQNTQADWFVELAGEGKLKGKSSLDLGCGTGMKSIFLAENLGFDRCVGVDIAPRAVAIADQNVRAHHVEDACEFICHDVSDLAFLGDETFDLVVDWAAIHCIDPSDRREYAKQIDTHSKAGARLLIRSFATTDTEKVFFEEEVEGVREKIFFLSEKELFELFPNFNVLERNTSKPKTKPESYYFIELLLEKK